MTVKSCQVVAQGRQMNLQSQGCITGDKWLLLLSKPGEDGESAGVDPRHGPESLPGAQACPLQPWASHLTSLHITVLFLK